MSIQPGRKDEKYEGDDPNGGWKFGKSFGIRYLGKRRGFVENPSIFYMQWSTFVEIAGKLPVNLDNLPLF